MLTHICIHSNNFPLYTLEKFLLSHVQIVELNLKQGALEIAPYLIARTRATGHPVISSSLAHALHADLIISAAPIAALEG